MGLMFNPMATLDINKNTFRDPAQRRAWISYQLKLQGRSLASLARDLGVTRGAPGRALGTPYPRMERALADAVGLPVHTLFPERYSPTGQRLIRMGRPRGKEKNSGYTGSKNTTLTHRGNVHFSRADSQRISSGS